MPVQLRSGDVSLLPEMAYWRSCMTTVHLISGFEYIQYQILALDEDSSEHLPDQIRNSGQQRLILEKIAFDLLKSDVLVAVDPRQSYLWKLSLSVTQDIHSTIDKNVETNFKLKVITSGSCASKDLLELIDQSIVGNQGTTSSAKATKSGDQIEHANAPAISKEEEDDKISQNNLKFSRRDLYRALVSSCLAQLRFRLQRDYDALPLNARTFSVPPKYSSKVDPEYLRLQAHELDALLAGLDFQLTTSGELLISTRSRLRLVTMSKNRIATHEESSSQSPSPLKSLVRIVPSGRVAEMLADNLETGNRNRVWMRSWKIQTERWLHTQGIHLNNLQSEDSWALIKIPNVLSSKEELQSDKRHAGRFFIIDWPKALCFSYESTGVSNFPEPTLSTVDKAAAWFEPDENEENSAPYEEPIERALFSIENAETRNAMISSLNAAQNNLDAGKTTSKASELQNSQTSPMAMDNLSLNQIASGVYPTPPDGLLAQATPGSPSQNITRNTSQSDSANQNNDKVDESVATVFDKVETLDSTHRNNEDDPFESAGITDADFSFFDEPSQVMDTKMEESNGASPLQGDTDVNMADNKLEDEPDDVANLAINGDEEKRVTFETSAQDFNASNGRDQDEEMLDARSPAEDRKPGSSPPKRSYTPPLSPSMIKQNIFVDEATPLINNGYKWDDVTTKSLNALAFNPNISVADQKYLVKGRFGFDVNNSGTKPSRVWDGRIGSRRNSAISPEVVRRASQTWRRGSKQYSGSSKDHTTSSSESKSHDEPSENNDVGSMSESDEDESPSDESEDSSLKRRRFSYDGQSPRSGIKLPKDKASVTNFDTFPGRLAELYRYFEPDSSQSSLLDIPAPATRFKSSFPVLPITEMKNILAVSQLLADQVSRTSLNLLPPEYAQDPAAFSTDSLTSLLAVNNSVKGMFTNCRTLDIESVVSPDIKKSSADDGAEDTDVETSTLPPNKSPEGDTSIFDVEGPRVHLQKQQSSWHGMSSAVNFWQTLGLGPANGPKDVIALYVCPYSAAIEKNVDLFFESIGNAYESHNLGAFSRHRSKVVEPERVQRPFTLQSIMKAFADTCVDIGNDLVSLDLQNKTVVTYIINPFNEPKALRDLFTCFLALVEKYHSSTKGIQNSRARTNKIIPQVIPIHLIVSLDAPVFLDPPTAGRIARETYDRCLLGGTDLKQPFLSIASYASIELEELAPTKIEFQLTTQTPSDLLREDFCLHIAYSCSWDNLWISAAWTDNSGRFQTSASYCLAGPISFEEIAYEIWNTTVDMVKSKKICWRIFITSTRPMLPQERKVWQKMTQTSTCFKIRTYILSVDTTPHLHVFPKFDAESPPDIHPATATAAATITTPISTPTPSSQVYSALSPQTAPTPATPSSSAAAAAGPTTDPIDADPTARIIDVTSATAGLLLPHPRSVSSALTAYNPALASGYLLKRNADEPAVLEVNIMDIYAGEERDRDARGVLREVLGAYGGLGVLARARGVEGARGARPWHVAVAMRASEGLRVCMGL